MTGPRTSPAQRPPAPDDELVESARGGDRAAFEALAAVRLAGLFRLARAILGDDDRAADAVSLSLLAAWRELPRLDEPARFDDWLDRILISECRHRLGETGGPRGGVMPADLLAGTMTMIRAAPQGSRPRAGRNRTVGAVVLTVVMVVAAVAAAGVLLRHAPDVTGTGGAGSSATPGAAAGSTDPGLAGAPTVAPPGTPASLDVGVIAQVTLVGNDLRVRTEPGVGAASRRLKPVLPAGTRMLVVGGPVTVDGYDWFEVQTDGELIDLFGWVAAGKDGVAWIEPVAPRCGIGLGPSAIVDLRPVEFLACFGSRTVDLKVDASALWNAPPPSVSASCGWARDTGKCTSDNGWLLFPAAPVTVLGGASGVGRLDLAMPPDYARELRKVPRQPTLVITVSMDAPEAAACRVRDAASGQDVVSPDEAVTACRLHLAVQKVTFREPKPPTPSASPASG